MDSKRKQELIKSLSNDSNDFNDVLSRKERKKQAKQKKFEDKLIKELERNKQKRMIREQKEREKLEKTQKIKLDQQSLKQLEDTVKLQQKQMMEIKKDLEDTKKISKISCAESTETHPSRWGKFTKFYLWFTFLGAFAFLGFNIYLSFSKIEQVYTILNSALITAFAVSFILTSLIMKETAKKKMTIFTSFMMLGLIGFNVAVSTDILKLPKQAYIEDFSNQSIAKVITWADANHVKLDYEYDFSDSIKTNKVIRQNVKPNTLAKKIKKLEVVVSGGPNYDLSINLPDMIGWHIDDVVKTIKKEKMNNVIIDYAFSEEQRDLAIEQSRNGEMKRNDELKMKFSLGLEEDLEPVKMKDLINMEEFDATLWLKRNGIKYEIKYEFNDDIDKGHVVSTDPKEGTLVNQKEMTVTLVISKGKKIKAPDFTTMTVEEISAWAEKNKVSIQFGSEYHTDIASEKIIRASVKKGDTIEEGQIVYIITSKGMLKMISFGKNDLDKIRNFGAENGLNINVIEQFSDVKAGEIISVSVKPGDSLTQGQGIEVIVSKGKSVNVPNFIGMTIAKAKTACQNNGLTCTFNYACSSKQKGTIINQNKNAGSELVRGSSVILTVSQGKRPSGGNNSGNQSGNGGNNDNNTKPPVCNPQTFTVGRDLNNIFNSGGTYASISSQLYSYFNAKGVKISVVGVTGTGMTPGSYVSGIGPGSTVTSCNTTAYIIRIAQ